MMNVCNRDYSLDIIRIVACAMIVLIHSPHPASNAGNGLLLVLISYLTAPGIGLFFMVSGALSLGNMRSFDTCAFLRKRMVRILVPLVFWSAVGYGLEFSGIKNHENGVLWFMYCISGLYLLTPVLKRWMDAAGAREIEFYLLIWACTLCVPIVQLFMYVDEGDTSWLYYFHGYVGYYVLGGYMNKFYGKTESLLYRHKSWLLVSLLIISFAFPIAMRLMHVETDFYRLFWYLSISVALMCVVYWIGLKRLCDYWGKMPEWIASVSGLTFGIYLVHILIMRNVLWQMDWMVGLPGYIQIAVCAILTFGFSWLVSYVLSKVRYVRMIIGM